MVKRGIKMKKNKISFVIVGVIIFSLFFFSIGKTETSSSNCMKDHVDDDGNVFSYNKGNVKKNKGKYIVQVWEKIVYSAEGREKEIQDSKKDGLSTEEWDNLSYEIDLLEIDCMMRRNRILSILFYDTDGKVSWSYDYDKPKWTSIVSGSEMDSLQKEVCK